MASVANSHLKRISLELGGKSPLVIMDDANGKLQNITPNL